MRLENKVALVTGAGRGVGRGIALEFAHAGAAVALNYLDEAAEAERLCAAIVSGGGTAIAVQADVSDHDARESLFSQVADEFGRLDILVNNAGVDLGRIPFLSLDESRYESIVAVNIRGTLFCCQAAARMMVERATAGRIVNISSIHSHLTMPGRTTYAASKGAIEAMTRALALDLAPYAITVNAIAPGFIEVERTVQATGNYDRDAVGVSIPAGRVGFPADVGALAVFLATPEASFITGQVIGCDGGSAVKLDITH